MKTVLLVCIMLLGPAVACAQAGTGNSPGVADGSSACTDESDLRAAQHIVATWIEGYNGGNAARVAALYTRDAYYLTQHYVTGIVHGRAGIQAYVQRGVDAGYHIDSIRIVHVGCARDFMYVITRYESTNAGQKAFGINLVVTRKTSKGWRIVAHEAAVPDPATAVQNLNVPGSH
jgi:ketosteroid isomerase-like protein